MAGAYVLVHVVQNAVQQCGSGMHLWTNCTNKYNTIVCDNIEYNISNTPPAPPIPRTHPMLSAAESLAGVGHRVVWIGVGGGGLGYRRMLEMLYRTVMERGGKHLLYHAALTSAKVDNNVNKDNDGPSADPEGDVHLKAGTLPVSATSARLSWGAVSRVTERVKVVDMEEHTFDSIALCAQRGVAVCLQKGALHFFNLPSQDLVAF
jgi:hypothetical protein